MFDDSEMMLFAGNANPALSRAVAAHLHVRLGKATVGAFSDGEIMVEIEENVRARDIFVLQSICRPTNDNLIEMLVLIDALRRASAANITAVIPYLGYARQDRRPRSGAGSDYGKGCREYDRKRRYRSGANTRFACGSDPGLFRYADGQYLRVASPTR